MLLIVTIPHSIQSSEDIGETSEENNPRSTAVVINETYNTPRYPFGHTDENISQGTGGSIITVFVEMTGASSPELWYEICYGGACYKTQEAMVDMGNDLYKLELNGSQVQGSADGSFPENMIVNYSIKDGKWESSLYPIYIYSPPDYATIDVNHETEFFPGDNIILEGTVNYNSTDNKSRHAMMENSDVNITIKNSSWSSDLQTQTNRTGFFSEELTAPSQSGPYTLNITAQNDTWDVDAYYSSQIEVIGLSVSATLNQTTSLPGRSIRIDGTANLTNGDIPVGAEVSISINGTGLANTTVGSNGEFEETFSAPGKVGNYTVKVTVNHTDSGLRSATSLPLSVINVSKPEISVTDLEFDPGESILEGDEIEVIATIRNSGSGGAEFGVELSLDDIDNVIYSESISLSAGSTKKVYYNLTPSAGDHTIWASVDKTIDDNPDDNVKEKSFEVIERKPEIYLDDFYIVGSKEILEGDEIDLSFFLRNNGTGAAELSVAFSIGQKDNITKWFNVYIEADKEKNIRFDWIAVSGEHKLWMIVDPNGSLDDIVKKGERNITIRVSERLAELRLKNVRAFPKEVITHGGKIFIDAEVHNLGNKIADFDIALAVDSKDNVTSWTHLSLEPGEYKDINLTFTSTSKWHSVWLMVDYNGTVEERIKSDNTFYSPIGSVSQEPEVQTDGEETGLNLLMLIILSSLTITMALAVMMIALAFSVYRKVYWNRNKEDYESKLNNKKL